MREINITVEDNKNIKSDNKLLGNKYDNGITTLLFTFPSSFDLAYKYLAIKNIADTNFYLVDIRNGSFLLSDFYTKNAGTYNLIVLISDTEIEEGNIDNDGINYISNTLEMTITNNFLDDNFIIKEQEVIN